MKVGCEGNCTGALAENVIVYVGVPNAGFRASRNGHFYKRVGLLRVNQFACGNDKAGASAVGLPIVFVIRPVTERREALQKNRVGIAHVLGPYYFIERAGVQDFGEYVPCSDKAGFAAFSQSCL
jgi:hypothetical protein